MPGYEGNGLQCLDIDECKTGAEKCHSKALCKNSDGTYDCSCVAGYTCDGLVCEDVDECAKAISTCSKQAQCTNKSGSYTCKCSSGYSGDGKTCTDIDECKKGTGKCSINGICVNETGGYSCKCKIGFVGSGKSCKATDLCLVDNGGCHKDANCVAKSNQPILCTCKTGFKGDGKTCTPQIIDVAIVSAVIAPGKFDESLWDCCGKLPKGTSKAVSSALKKIDPWAAVAGTLALLVAEPALQGLSRPDPKGTATLYHSGKSFELTLEKKENIFDPAWNVGWKNAVFSNDLKVTITLIDDDSPLGEEPIGTVVITKEQLAAVMASGKAYPVKVWDQDNGGILFVTLTVFGK
jgi:hypothetical protein